MKLEVDGIRFSYPSEPVLDGITFSAGEGDIVSLLGPNGVGKSTLLKCINKVLKASGGRVSVAGKDLAPMSPSETARTVGYVPQNGRTSPMTVFESVLLGRRPHMGTEVSERDLRVTGRTVSLLGLTELSQKPVNKISGGEFQLVQIARAVAQEPKVLIMDEPTSGLDLRNQHNVMKAIRGLVAKNRMCAVMVNHDINLALRYSDRFVLVSGGRVYAAGGKEAVTAENMSAVYGIQVDVREIDGHLMAIPRRCE